MNFKLITMAKAFCQWPVNLTTNTAAVCQFFWYLSVVTYLFLMGSWFPAICVNSPCNMSVTLPQQC